MYVVTLTFIQAVDDNKKWGVFKVESCRIKVAKRFDDELSELSVDGLVEIIGSASTAASTMCERAAGIARAI